MRKIIECTKEIFGGATSTFAAVPASLPGCYVVRVTHVPVALSDVTLADASISDPDTVASPGSLVSRVESGSAGMAAFAFESNGIGPVELSITADGDTETLGEFFVEVYAA
jgi:hypothetical protein